MSSILRAWAVYQERLTGAPTVCRTLLRRMAPEHKFATSARLCSEVLSGFADGALSLKTASEVLRDALHILASKDAKARLKLAELMPADCPVLVLGWLMWCVHHFSR